MKLLFDLGNTRCKWALANGALHPGAAVDYGGDFAQALNTALANVAQPQRVLAASVAGAERTTLLAEWLKRRYGLALQTVSAQREQCGVTNAYEVPAQLGADRWAALIGARARCPGEVCVVDCGTAVTVDALDGHGVFRGGVILPGLTTQRAALAARTSDVRTAEGHAASCLARTTADAVAAGTLFGLAGAIERILAEQARALGGTPHVLITGGDALAVQAQLPVRSEVVPHLVLEGLARIAEASP